MSGFLRPEEVVVMRMKIGVAVEQSRDGLAVGIYRGERVVWSDGKSWKLRSDEHVGRLLGQYVTGLFGLIVWAPNQPYSALEKLAKAAE